MPCQKIVYNSDRDWNTIKEWLEARKQPDPSLDKNVSEIIQSVRQQGDEALIHYSRQFDCPNFEHTNIKISSPQIEDSICEIPEKDLQIIKEAAQNIRAFHEKQKETSWFETKEKNLIFGQLVQPVQKAGIYIPGGPSGETPLISSLLMTAIPAKVAGVENIVMVTPPRKDGSINPYTLATAQLLEIKNVFAIGSAWAIAALAYGTETTPKVDMIAGPGNVYVTSAKKLLVGEVGIDMIAGPSEIAILADSSADPEWLAADLLSQAEHDTLASSLLITPEETIIDEVETALNKQLQLLPREKIARESLMNWGCLFHVPNLTIGMDLINHIAPEHFELCVDDPWSWLGYIHNAGAIFIGHYCPEPLGDYFSGPNHVLPTVGTARFSSALSVQSFCKKSTILSANKDYIQKHGEKVSRLARLEGLEAHAKSTEKRY